MKIALLGYGKMGKAIEQIALERGHEIVLKIGSSNKALITSIKADVAIDFSLPSTVVENIKHCFNQDIPIVVGTTGWNDALKEIDTLCHSKKQSLLYASNFSIGVNLFFEMNKKLAELMNHFEQYDVSINETHHTEKLDAPSGTALSLAGQITTKIKRKTKENLNIFSHRKTNVIGDHLITYTSEIDQIELNHKAKNRKGFAQGAVLAAEWLIDKKGLFTMTDMLNL